MKISRSMQEAASNLVPWNLNKLTFNGGDINWHSERYPTYEPINIRFKPDGSVVYFIASSFIHEITLSTSWDLGTGTLTNSADIPDFLIVTDLFFKSDGLTAFGIYNESVYEFSLSTAWDLDTLALVQTKDISGQSTTGRAVVFKSDGTKMFAADFSNVYEYTLSTAWDISTSTYVTSYTTGGSYFSLVFKSDGTVFYRRSKSLVIQYTLSTAWDISSVSSFTTYSIPTTVRRSIFTSGVGCFDISVDGSQLFISADDDVGTVFSLDLSSAWDVTSASLTLPSSDFLSLRSDLSGRTPKGIQFRPTGTNLFVASNNNLVAYNLSVPWDISSASFSVSVSSVSGITGFYFKPDGTALYLTTTNEDVREYSLSSPWSITTASYVRTFTPSSAIIGNDLTSVTFKPDGTKMYLTGVDIYEFNLSTPWNISTATYVGKFNPPFFGFPQGIYFREDGGAFYVVYYLSNIAAESYLVECEVGTPWSISTSQQETSINISQGSANAVDVYFRDTGRKAYVLSDQFEHILSYDL